VKVLLIGFGPFPGMPINPSGVLVKALVRRRRPALSGIVFTTHILATAYAAVDRDLTKLLAKKPDVVLMFGVANRRRHICIETRARNAMSMLFPDVRGYCPQSTAIAKGGPASLHGNAPFAELRGSLRASAIPARLSRDAGRYLCNYAYWRTLEQRHARQLIQFVHIPPVRLSPRRRGKERLPSFRRIAAAAETLLLTLIAASRR
jgi:pyroglutamyl-peptidase